MEWADGGLVLIAQHDPSLLLFGQAHIAQGSDDSEQANEYGQDDEDFYKGFHRCSPWLMCLM